MKIYLVFILVCILTNSNGQGLTHYDKDPFAFNVKVLDEFFERFNYQDSSFILKYLEYKSGSVILNRRTMVLSLFNQEDSSFYDPDAVLYTNPISAPSFFPIEPFTTNNIKRTWVNEFVTQVLDSAKPVNLSFYDKNWYAEVNCQFMYNNIPREVVLTLKNEVYQDPRSSKWVIVSASANFLEVPMLNKKDKLLSPMAHATEFMALNESLKDVNNLGSYFDQDFKPDAFSIFTYLIYAGQLQFIQTNKVSFHLLQIDGWILEIEYFNRRTQNSGWLISDLIKADMQIKKTYANNKLKIAYE